MGSERPRPWTTLAAVAVGALGLALPACSLDSDGSPLGIFGNPSGTGGAGATTGAGGAGAGFSTLDWTALEPEADGTLALPPELHLSSPSGDKTSQIGPDAIRAGFGPDAPRARNPSGETEGWGLSVEPERRNRIWPSEPAALDAGKWIYTVPGTVTPAFEVGPGGSEAGMTASQITSDAAANGPYAVTFSQETGSRSWSLWVRRHGGSVAYHHLARRFPGMAIERWPFEPYVDTWSRKDRAFVLADESVDMMFDARPTINTVQNGDGIDLLVAYAQYEEGAYPSSAIPTTTAARTREAEHLSATALETLLPGGWIDVELHFAPHYASGEQAGDHDLVHIDTNNRLFVKLDGTVVLLIQGEELATEPLVWTRDVEIRVVARSTAEGRTLSVTGTTPAGEVSGAAKEPIAPPPAELHLLGGALGGGKFGAQEGADLRYIAFR